jgi:hypothetical protein
MQLVKADQDNAEAIVHLQEEVKTLRSALTAHAKRALPATPAMPLSAPFMEAIKGSIITQVHEHILPIIAQTRTEMSELISMWIESNPDDATGGGGGNSGSGACRFRLGCYVVQTLYLRLILYLTKKDLHPLII